MDEWDDAAPWAPWASLDDPWEEVELDASWTATPLEQLLGNEDSNGRGLGARPMSGPGSVSGLTPEEAPLWTLRAIPTGAERDNGVGAGRGLEYIARHVITRN